MKPLGRAFNHLEDLTFFYGSLGVCEAVSHLHDMATKQGSNSIRMKWDGSPQIYWGREHAGGPLVLASHNSWSRGVKTQSPQEIRDFIINQSGNAQTSQEIAARKKFADQFGDLYAYFDSATPEDFQGFVYADALFLEQPTSTNQTFSFSPNAHSQTCYHVSVNSDLGKRIQLADVMVVGHAYFPKFGMLDHEQQPISDFEMFNNNHKLIVLGPVYNQSLIDVNLDATREIIHTLEQHCHNIDQFLETRKGLSDLKNIIYRYVNQSAKNQQLDDIGTEHFMIWMKNSTVSSNKQQKIKELNLQFDNPIGAMLKLVTMIQNIKDDIINQLEDTKGEIWDTNGEGRVRYADASKQFGNIKLVPRKRWTPA